MIQIQERLDAAAKQHIVPLIGFCFQLPQVAILLQYCDGGDLLHRLQRGVLNTAHPPAMGHQSSDVEIDMQSLSQQLVQEQRQRIRWALEVPLHCR